jgi:phospholipid N-methyltransferase
VTGSSNGDERAFSKSLASYLHFFWAGLCRHEQTGGIIPSQKFLIEKMIAPVPRNYTGEIVELGTGSGALTLRLAARCSRARILACEINPVLASDTERNLFRAGLNKRVQVISEAAETFLSRKRREGRAFDFILSGIPLGNLDREQSFGLINCIHSALRSGGMYIQFQHSLLDRKKIEVSFSKLKTVQAFLNFPPAVVYYAQK